MMPIEKQFYFYFEKYEYKQQDDWKVIGINEKNK